MVASATLGRLAVLPAECGPALLEGTAAMVLCLAGLVARTLLGLAAPLAAVLNGAGAGPDALTAVREEALVSGGLYAAAVGFAWAPDLEVLPASPELTDSAGCSGTAGMTCTAGL